MISGTAYGVVLNDRDEIAALGDALNLAPYQAPPRAPVVYIKPRTCIVGDGAPVALAADVPEVTLAATLGLLFVRDVAGGADGTGAIGGACLALDLSVPHAGFYRPAIRQRCRDGFLPLGSMVGWGPHLADATIETAIDGRAAHAWALARLVRPIPALIAALSAFMTLRAGDLLLVGLPGDAPRAGVGARIEARAAGLPLLRLTLVAEAA